MKKLWFLLLAVCLISFLTGCDGGGGGSSSGGGGGDGGSTIIYITSALLDDDGVTGFSIVDGVMTYTWGGDNWEQYSKLTIDTENKTFELYEKEKINGVGMADTTFYGTWTGDGTTTVNAHCSSYKFTGDPTEYPDDWDTVFAIDGNTTYWTSGEPFNWIWTKQ